MKFCSACQLCKSPSDFHKNKSKEDGLQNQCKMCHARSRKDSYSRYRRTRINNQVKYNKNRYHTDDTYRLNCLLRSRLNSALTSQSTSKVESIHDLIGCSINVLKQWLNFTKEFYIPEGYTGKIHIDHFYPLARFDLTKPKNVKYVMNWSHLRYLTAEQNLKKSDKMPNKQDRLKRMFLVFRFYTSILSSSPPQSA